MLDFGFAAVSLSGLMISVFIGAFAVSKEIETKTIYTVLSKPVSRTTLILGKFAGCFLVLAVSHVSLGLVLAGVVHLAGESLPHGFAECIFLILLENTVVLGIGFFFSIVSRGFLAGSFTLAIFVIGRSSLSLLAIAEKGTTPEVRAIAHGIYWLAPNLERYNIRDVVAYGKEFPWEMIPHGLEYTALYVVLSLGAAGLLFNRKEIP